MSLVTIEVVTERTATSKARVLTRIDQVAAAWGEALAVLGPEGIETAAAGHGDVWRVRDVLAHFNGWDRWQLVQLRTAFTGEVAEESELTGGLSIAAPDPALSWNDGMNAAFVAANASRRAAEVVADWRENGAMRRRFVAAADQARLDVVIGADWSPDGTPGRHLRLRSERPEVIDPKSVAIFVLEQVEHASAHLAGTTYVTAGGGGHDR